MLEVFDLKQGSHSDPSAGTCAMEVVAWLAGEPHTDKPQCACPVIGRFVIAGNDTMDHRTRQRLKAFIPRISGSRDPAAERARYEYLAWAAITVFAPIALDLAGLHDQAKTLRDFNKSLGLRAAAKAAADAAKGAAYAAYAAYAAKAAYAAYAAKGAADAAYAATYAADAANAAANAAADAAKAATYAAKADAAKAAAKAANAADAADLWNSWFDTLDGALSLGAQGSNDYDFTPRVDAFRREVLEPAQQ